MLLVATSFDSEEEVLTKYPESRLILQKMSQISKSKDSRVSIVVQHRVDAT